MREGSVEVNAAGPSRSASGIALAAAAGPFGEELPGGEEFIQALGGSMRRVDRIGLRRRAGVVLLLSATVVGTAWEFGPTSRASPHTPLSDTQIVFTSPWTWHDFHGGWTYVRSLRGGRWHQLPRFVDPNGGSFDQRPRAYSWSPDGKYLLDNLDPNGFDSQYLPIQLLGPSGKLIRPLTPGGGEMVGFNPTWAPGSTQILLSGRGLYNGSFWGGFFREALRGQVAQLRTDPKFIPADDTVQFSGDARDPAADIWLRAWREDNRRSYWLPRAHRILVASFSIDGPPYFWQSLDTDDWKQLFAGISSIQPGGHVSDGKASGHHSQLSRRVWAWQARLRPQDFQKRLGHGAGRLRPHLP